MKRCLSFNSRSLWLKAPFGGWASEISQSIILLYFLILKIHYREYSKSSLSDQPSRVKAQGVFPGTFTNYMVV